MKLNDLKALIRDIEATKLETNDNPDISFYIARDEERLTKAGPKDARSFVDFDVIGDAGYMTIRDCMVTVSHDSVHKQGDFCLELTVRDFYA